MNDISVKISLFHNLFQISLILALIFLAIAIAVFFKLDIRSTIGYLTGRRAKKKIKELEAATAVSGRLMPNQRTNMQYVAQEMKDDMGVRQNTRLGIRKVEHAVEAAVPITEEMQTDVLTQQTMPDSQMTDDAQATTVLSESNGDISTGNGSTAVLESGTFTRGRFVIVRELMLIHTEEVI